NRSVGEWGAVFGDPVVATVDGKAPQRAAAKTCWSRNKVGEKKLERSEYRKPLVRFGALHGALARDLLHVGNAKGGQFLMSPRGNSGCRLTPSPDTLSAGPPVVHATTVGRLQAEL